MMLSDNERERMNKLAKRKTQTLAAVYTLLILYGVGVCLMVIL
jgi:predicted nucleic acid-binding Zn ribbon protein